MNRAATVAHLQNLESEHRIMVLANRYLKARQPRRLAELGIPPAEVQRLIKAGGYSSLELMKMREKIYYYGKKSRRKLWLPGDH